MVRSNESVVFKTPAHAQPGSNAFMLRPPLVFVGIPCCQRIWVLLGLGWGREPFTPACAAFTRLMGLRDPGLTQHHANFSLGPCLTGVGMVVIVGPPWLALLAPFVQSSGHILVTGASARA